MRINNDISSLQNANVNSNMNAIRQKWAEKLGSGQSINNASDDPAGIAISEKMRGEIRTLSQTRSNHQDALSFLNSTDGAMSQINDNLVEMQKLATQLNNPLMSANNQATVRTQMQSVADSITNTLDNSKLNGIDLFGENSTSGMTEEFVNGLRSLSGSSSLDDITAQVDSLNSMRADVGARANQAESNVRNIATQMENLTAAESQIRDTDMAEAYSGWSISNILSNSSNAMLSHSMLNAQNVMSLLK